MHYKVLVYISQTFVFIYIITEILAKAAKNRYFLVYVNSIFFKSVGVFPHIFYLNKYFYENSNFKSYFLTHRLNDTQFF